MNLQVTHTQLQCLYSIITKHFLSNIWCASNFAYTAVVCAVIYSYWWVYDEITGMFFAGLFIN